jgi:peroxiredoxin
MLALGTTAPDFRLPDTSGKTVSPADFKSAPALLVIFMCNHCPYVKHIRQGLAQLGRDYQPKGVAMVGINSNDVANYPADSPAKMKEEAASAGYTFPYLYDETQSVAKAYRAACTPDVFLFDGRQKLVYRGQLDDSRPGNGLPVTSADLRAALDAVLSGQPVTKDQKKPATPRIISGDYSRPAAAMKGFNSSINFAKISSVSCCAPSLQASAGLG